MLIVLAEDKCNLIRTTCGVLPVGRNNQLQRNGVKSQQSEQQLARGLDWAVGSTGASSVTKLLI